MSDVIQMPQVLERTILVPLHRAANEEPERIAFRVKELAAADNHCVIAPTHLMIKGEKTLGYLSLGGLPNVHAWFDSKHPHTMDSLKMIETGEAILRDKGATAYSLLCAEESPFTPHLERLGFTKLGTTVLYLKRL